MIHVLAIALWTVGVQDPAQENPLHPLTKIAKRLNEQVASFLKGADPAEAFKPWQLTEMNPEKLTKLRADLKTSDIASATSFGWEFELYFLSEGKCVYRIKGFVFATGEQASLVEFRGAAHSESRSATLPLAECTGDLAPFREAAEALVTDLKAGKSSRIPTADPDDLAKLVSEKTLAEGKKEIERSRKELEKAAAELGKLGADEIRLRLDDQAFVAFDSKGAPKGFLKGEFELRKDGGVEFALKGFRRLE